MIRIGSACRPASQPSVWFLIPDQCVNWFKCFLLSPQSMKHVHGTILPILFQAFGSPTSPQAVHSFSLFRHLESLVQRSSFPSKVRRVCKREIEHPRLLDGRFGSQHISKQGVDEKHKCYLYAFKSTTEKESQANFDSYMKTCLQMSPAREISFKRPCWAFWNSFLHFRSEKSA